MASFYPTPPPRRHHTNQVTINTAVKKIPAQDEMTRECLLFPTYAYRNPKDSTEWVIPTRGWALSHNRSAAKQKFVASLSKGVVGQNSGDQVTFQDRFKYFLAKNKRNRQFIIKANGIHSTWSHPSTPQRRDSDGSADSGFQSSGTTKDETILFDDDDDDDTFLFDMERPVNPLSSILSGSRVQSTSSLCSNDSRQYDGDNDDDNDDLPSMSDTSTLASSLFTSSPSYSSSITSINMDGQITFKSEGSGFFSGLTRLPHQQVLQWAKEKDCCDARLVRLEALGTRSFPVSTGMVNLVEPTGISIISDIDDTIKETQILHGARTVLANTFFNPSKDIPGMAEAYMKWYTQGASFHYVSNSPFQLLSFLQDFLHTSHFPPGSMHLRLEGSLLARLIEIPGRAKRDAILKILQDFPHRHFVLVGDSGEIDLEIYTKIALEHPGRILKIFIHNVTTPYALHKAKKKSSQQTSEDSSSSLLGMASSSVLGLGRTKTLADLIIDPVPPAASQQCMQLYDRVQKARDQLSIDVVLFDSADTLRDDPVVQEALWQHWDSQTP